MNLAQGVERRLERLAEGASASLFRGRLHPVAIGSRLVRQLEFSSEDTPAGPTIPNDLVVGLHPSDLDPDLNRDELVGELERAVIDTAEERGWRLVGPVRIQLQTNAGTPRGVVSCTGSIIPGRIEPWAQLISVDGSAVVPITLIRTLIGRALDCDVRLANDTVSRHHALMWREGGRVLIRDLGSSNGTVVNDVQIIDQEVPVTAGDTIIIGGLAFGYRKLI